MALIGFEGRVHSQCELCHDITEAGVLLVYNGRKKSSREEEGRGESNDTPPMRDNGILRAACAILTSSASYIRLLVSLALLLSGPRGWDPYMQ